MSTPSVSASRSELIARVVRIRSPMATGLLRPLGVSTKYELQRERNGCRSTPSSTAASVLVRLPSRDQWTHAQPRMTRQGRHRATLLLLAGLLPVATAR